MWDICIMYCNCIFATKMIECCYLHTINWKWILFKLSTWMDIDLWNGKEFWSIHIFPVIVVVFRAKPNLKIMFVLAFF